MSKRMISCFAIGTLALALATTGCDDGIDPEPAPSAADAPVNPTSTSIPGGIGGLPTSIPGSASIPAATPAAVPEPASAPSTGLGCKDLFDCYATCPQTDSACQDACWAKGSPQGQQLENAIWSCAQQNNCQDWQCVEQACGAQMQACTADTTAGAGEVATPPSPSAPPAGGLGCLELFQCYDQCSENDNACYNACWAQGSPQGQQTENAIWGCAQQNDCQDWQCVEQSCGTQLQACFG